MSTQDPRWTADTEELVAREGLTCDPESWELQRDDTRAMYRRSAAVILGVLADAGLLLEEWPARFGSNPSPECMSGGRLHDDCDNDLGCTCECHQDATSGPQGDEPAAPRVWAVPEIPADVQRLTAVGGDILADREPEDPRYWEVRSAATGRVLAPYLLDSQLITAYGPLTEVDGNQT